MTSDGKATGEVSAPGVDAPRLMMRLPWGKLLCGLGLAVASASLLVFSPPGSTLFFSTDGGPLSPLVSAAFDWVRLCVGVAGLLLVAVGCLAGRLSGRPSPARVGDAIVALLACVIGLTMVEVGLRVRGSRTWGSAFRTPLTLDAMRRDDTNVPQPGVFVQTARSDFDGSYQRTVFFTINRYGVRGGPLALPKPAGVQRIVCLGGSTTFGWSVTDGQDWPSLLDRLLGGGVEVVNAGRSGATTFRNFPYLRDHLLRLDPDVVVLYEGFNDMWRGYRLHGGERHDYGPVDEGIAPGNEPLDQGGPLPWPWRPLFLTYHIGQKLEQRLSAPGHPGPEPTAETGPFVFDPEIVAIYEQNLVAMARLCRRNGVAPVIATFAGCDDPTLPQDAQRERLAYVLREMPAFDVAGASEALELYREATRRVARAEDVPLVDLATLMTKDLTAYTDTVHFTPEGERQMAELMAEALRTNGLLSGGRRGAGDEGTSPSP